MTKCKYFQNCSAPICPLDDDWQKRKHLDGERVCFYLTEYSKEAARPILRGCLDSKVYQRIVEVYPLIIYTVGSIRKQLKRSANNPPRVNANTLVEL